MAFAQLNQTLRSLVVTPEDAPEVTSPGNSTLSPSPSNVQTAPQSTGAQVIQMQPPQSAVSQPNLNNTVIPLPDDQTVRFSTHVTSVLARQSYIQASWENISCLVHEHSLIPHDGLSRQAVLKFRSVLNQMDIDWSYIHDRIPGYRDDYSDQVYNDLQSYLEHWRYIMNRVSITVRDKYPCPEKVPRAGDPMVASSPVTSGDFTFPNLLDAWERPVNLSHTLNPVSSDGHAHLNTRTNVTPSGHVPVHPLVTTTPQIPPTIVNPNNTWVPVSIPMPGTNSVYTGFIAVPDGGCNVTSGSSTVDVRPLLTQNLSDSIRVTGVSAPLSGSHLNSTLFPTQAGPSVASSQALHPPQFPNTIAPPQPPYNVNASSFVPGAQFTNSMNGSMFKSAFRPDVKLPQMELGRFSGKQDEYSSFKDHFTTVIN